MARCGGGWIGKAVQWTLIATLVLAAATPARAQEIPEVPGEACLQYRSPVTGKYEQIPLRHTDVAIDVRGLIASATVTQQYTNNSTTPIEAVYVFPLPHDAAVYDMEIRISNRVINSVVREREEAKRVYEAAKSEGKRAALVEEERPNIFTTSVANIMPGDKIEVRMRYVESLKWEDGHVRLNFPMTVGPRYIPGTVALGQQGAGSSGDTDQVPDASRITPVVRHPDNRNGHDISLSVDLDLGFDPQWIQSVSHTIDIKRTHDGHVRVQLAGGTTIPNRDFVLEVQRGESKTPVTALYLSPANDSGETHFVLTAYPPSVAPTTRMPMEMLYMIDVSGSMEGTSIAQARDALLNALDRLAPSDRFGILAFSSGYREFASEPLIASSQNLDAARRYVRNLQAGGGTEMLPALMHLMTKPTVPGYIRQIVLLTDGDLGNEEAIFTAMRTNLGDARLFTVAIGSAPNLFLATKMAQFGRGTFTHIADNTETREKMSALFDSIESPVLTDVKLQFEGVKVTDIYPKRLPDLFQRQPLLIYGRITSGHAGRVHLKARNGNVPYGSTIGFDIGNADFHPGITTLWARQRVEDLMDDWRHANEAQQKDIRDSIVAHAVRYHLVTKFTSLLAVEEVVVNPSGQANTVPVATELPAGMNMDAVFGAPATGTADDFLQAFGLALFVIGVGLCYLTRNQQGARA
jgi:Ca-activated chloride channel family protein